MNNMVARQFFHGTSGPANGNRAPEISLEFHMSFGAGRFRDPDTRFFLHVFNRSHNEFVSDATLRRAFKIHVNNLLLDHCPSGSEMQQYVDLTSQFKHLPEKSNVRVHIAGPLYFWAEGTVSVLCMSIRPPSESVTRLYEQTLRRNGIALPPPLVLLPPGYKSFENVYFQNLEDARRLFTERIVDKLPPSTLGSKRNGVADDDEIQMGNQIVSFQCPLSLIRIRNPAKSIKCVHKQCFDAEDLVIEPTFSRLLAKYPNADRCVILPSGEDQAIEEHQQATGSFSASKKGGSVDADGFSINGGSSGGTNGNNNNNSSSSSGSINNSSNNNNNKRKHSEMLLSDVIELSDDEIDELGGGGGGGGRGSADRGIGGDDGFGFGAAGGGNNKPVQSTNEWGDEGRGGGASDAGGGYGIGGAGAASAHSSSMEPPARRVNTGNGSNSGGGLGGSPRPPWDGTVITLDD
ncbi:SUMO ligase siz1 [Geranomyces michiganensis]|nr:SUMO ligase siz1 [Geranomyces michiganensis]